MTFFEFLAEEAKREGKSPGDIMEEMAKATADDNARMEDNYRNPEEALKALMEGYESDDEEGDPDCHRPEKVLEVLEVKAGSSFSGSGLFILARVHCADGQERIAEYHYQYWSGTRMEPPEMDCQLMWHDSVDAYHSSVERRKLDEIERKKKLEENRQKWMKQRTQ